MQRLEERERLRQHPVFRLAQARVHAVEQAQVVQAEAAPDHHAVPLRLAHVLPGLAVETGPDLVLAPPEVDAVP